MEQDINPYHATVPLFRVKAMYRLGLWKRTVGHTVSLNIMCAQLHVQWHTVVAFRYV